MDEPFLLMIAGPNGSGKTTLFKRLQKENFDLGEYINPDDIAGQLSGSYEERTRLAQRLADERREECIAAKRSFSFETVMSHPSKLELLIRAKEAGYFIQVFFVGVDDPATNLERVALRVKQGGHDVPPDKVVSRWHRTMKLLPDAIRSADQAFVFDNSIAGIIDNGPRLVLRRNFIQKRSLPVTELFPPVPDWVEQYVVEPLGINAASSNFGNAQVLRSVVTATAGTASTFNSKTAESGGDARQADTAEFRAPPCDIKIEQALLGKILLDNDSFYRVGDFLTLTSFYEPLHQKLYQVISDLIRAGKAATSDTVKSLLPTDMDVAGLGIKDYLEFLKNSGADAQDIGQDGRVLHDFALRRSLIVVGEDISNAAYEAPTDLNPIELVTDAERRITDLIETWRAQRGFLGLGHALLGAIDKMAQAYQRDSRLPGLSTGLVDVDRLTSGLQKPDLILVAARPEMGSSAFATNVAFSIAKSWKAEQRPDGTINTVSGGVVGYFSLDVSAERIASRIISAQSNVPLDNLTAGAFSESDFDRIVTASREMQTVPLYIDDTGGLSFSQLAGRARRLKRQRDLDLLIIDNVHLLHGDSGRKADSKLTQETCANLKELASELNIPVLALATLSQRLERRSDKRPRLSDLVLSDLPDHAADVIMFLYREEYYLSLEQPPVGTYDHNNWLRRMEGAHGVAEVIVAKQRNGRTGSIILHFDTATQQFSAIPSWPTDRM